MSSVVFFHEPINAVDELVESFDQTCELPIEIRLKLTLSQRKVFKALLDPVKVFVDTAPVLIKTGETLVYAAKTFVDSFKSSINYFEAPINSVKPLVDSPKT